MQQQIDPFFFQQEEEQDFNPKAILHKYLAYWKWFALSLAMSISAAFIYLSYKSPEYHIHSSVLIKDEKKGLGGGEDLLKQLDVFGSNKVVENEIEVLKSYTLMEKVVNDLHLNISYVVRKGLRKEYLYTESPVQLQLINTNDIIYDEP